MWLTGKVWELSKKLSDLGIESNRAKILLQWNVVRYEKSCIFICLASAHSFWDSSLRSEWQVRGPSSCTGNFSKLPAPLKIQLMAACLQAIVRGMFEDLRGYKLSYIAAQIKVRSTLQNKRKPWVASKCPTECSPMRHEQRALVTIFPCAGPFGPFGRQKDMI